MSSPPALSTELALKAFEADQVFCKALVAVQAAALCGADTPSLMAIANGEGFAWSFTGKWNDGSSLWLVKLHHVAGAEASAADVPTELVCEALLGLLGCAIAGGKPLALAATDEAGQPEAPEAAPEPEPEVDANPAPPAPEPAEPDPATPLSDEQKAVAVEMVKAMGSEQRKAFTISFRSAFSVPRSQVSIAPLITEIQHLHFIDRFTVEAAGGVSP